MASNLARLRRHRERQREGRICLVVEVDEVALAVQLELAGFLHPDEADSRDALARALEHVVRLWCSETRFDEL